MPGVRLGNHVLRLEPFSVCTHKSGPHARWRSISNVVSNLGLHTPPVRRASSWTFCVATQASFHRQMI
ncbi:TPA: hypothetical protein ACH3X1_002474 [Trebouxia sp. C0004]